jgi:hypothetical protein
MVMEFWEGAILLVGGIWLVGQLDKRKTTVIATVSSVGTVGPQGNTIATNTDGSTALVAGEPLTPGAASVPILTNTGLTRNPVASYPSRSPVTSKTTAASVGARNTLMPAKKFYSL